MLELLLSAALAAPPQAPPPPQAPTPPAAAKAAAAKAAPAKAHVCPCVGPNSTCGCSPCGCPAVDRRLAAEGGQPVRWQAAAPVQFTPARFGGACRT